MKIISWNVNGIRAVERKGDLRKFVDQFDPSLVLFQEIKATHSQLKHLEIAFSSYDQFYHPALKPGYAGTGIWVKKDRDFELEGFETGFPDDFDYPDTEGRIASINLKRNNQSYKIFGVYFPNGGKSSEAWQEKLVFYDRFLAFVNQVRSEGKICIWAGDINCAHEPIDLARPKENEDQIGFLPEERSWVSRCIAEGWTDVFRKKYPEAVVYSWWHVLSGARKRNVGWRIDAFFIDETFLPCVQSIEYLTHQMGSDHCPVRLEMV